MTDVLQSGIPLLNGDLHITEKRNREIMFNSRLLEMKRGFPVSKVKLIGVAWKIPHCICKQERLILAWASAHYILSFSDWFENLLSIHGLREARPISSVMLQTARMRSKLVWWYFYFITIDGCCHFIQLASNDFHNTSAYHQKSISANCRLRMTRQYLQLIWYCCI